MSIAALLRQMIIGMAATRQGLQIFQLYVRLIDKPISRLTKGATIPSANWNIMPIVYLTTTGAKSRRARSMLVLCIPDGENLILVASNWGKTQNPGWAYNLRANPKVQVRKGKMIKDFVAHELLGDERTAYWQKSVTFYPPYVSYEQRSGRSLPIFLLEP
jgi:F420H(2)-dependent quinone reductase